MPSSSSSSSSSRPESKNAKAKRAIRCLATSVMVPVGLTTAVVFLFSSSRKYNGFAKMVWLPPLWFVHLASVGSSFLMGLAAWLVWADGGLHPQSDALPLYVAQLSLSLTWDPLVLVIGAVWLGLVFGVVHFGTLFACYLCFRRVNPFAKDLVKPCLVWAACLCAISFRICLV